MMGMLPPVDGNLRGGLNSWLKDKTLWRVQRALLAAEGGAFARAKSALEAPLRQVMQKYPAPDMVWRTATKNHKLGGLKIKKDERLFVGIVSATLQDRAAGGHDVYPIFGGNRRPKDGGPRPRHACPAHRMAMGTLMGILTALLDKGSIEPLTAPLMIDLVDPNGPDGRPGP
jgi:hypothetical protein